MKNGFMILALTIVGWGAMGQQNNANLPIDHKNEIGLDATGFIKRFLSFGNSYYDYGYGYGYGEIYNPTYQVTYRRLFNAGNIRFGVGGSYNSEDFQKFYSVDSTIRTRMNNSFDARLGWEFKTELSKRWQVYYGVDFRTSYTYFKDDDIDFNASYASGVETNTQVFGLAPLLGFRFKITPRLSLTTEASFALNIQESKTRNYYSPRYEALPPIEDVKAPTLKSVYGTFNQPLSVIITFNL